MTATANDSDSIDPQPSLAGEKLPQSQHQFESLVHSIGGIVWELDCSTWRFTFVSKEAERMIGYPVQQWLDVAEFWEDHLHPEDREWAIKLCRDATERGEDHEFEYRMIAADGRVVWLRDIVTVEVKDGRPARLRGVMVDVTERKKQEGFSTGQSRVLEMIATGAPLVDVLTKLVLLLESQSDGMLGSVLLLNEDGVTIRHAAAPSLPESYVKAINCARIGPRAGSCGTAMYSGKPVIVTDILEDPLWEAYRDLAVAHGLRACWSWPILSTQGKILGTFAMYYREARSPSHEDIRLTDIATHIAGIAIDRQRADESLRQSEARTGAILRAIPDLMFLQSGDGVYLDYHAANQDDLYVPADQFLGKNMRDVLPAEMVDRFVSAFERAAESDEPQTLEYDLPLQRCLRQFEARVVHCGGDRFLTIVREITERRRAEAALRESEAELRRSHHQVRELAGMLISAQEEERRRISRELHDDLNQKVAALSIFVSRLKRQLTDPAPAIVDQLGRMQACATELAERIRQISHQLHPAALEHAGLPAALRSFVSEFSQLENLDIQLTVPGGREDIPQEVAICLYRIVQESLRNVAKHSGAKRAAVTLSVKDGIVKLVIEDQGRGFDPDHLHRGSGLGVVSMEERVRLIQGRFLVSSQVGAGTTLLVMIPLRVA